MASTVKSRPNHYERLGLAPTASSEEISKAFATETSVFRPQPFGGIAELCVAFETLRDPIKRRAYDASLGMAAPASQVPTTGPRWRQPLPTKVSHGPMVRPGNQFLRPPEPQLSPKPRREPATQRAPGPIDAALSRPINPNARDIPPAPAPKPETTPDQQSAPDHSHHLGLEERFGVEVRPIEWKRTGFVAGAVAVAACVVGTLVGWWSVSDVGNQPQPRGAVSVPLPQVSRSASATVPQAAPADRGIEAPALQPERVALPAAKPERRPTVRQLAAQEQVQEGRSQESLFDPIEPDPGAGNQAPDVTAPASAVAASLPLPNKVVARTIQRIGYACSEVASTSPVEGEAPGVYKVTCASGHAYQARPVNGRYHFRRWGRN